MTIDYKAALQKNNFLTDYELFSFFLEIGGNKSNVINQNKEKYMM